MTNKKVFSKATGMIAIAGVLFLSGGLMMIKDYKQLDNNFNVISTTTNPEGNIITLTEPKWESIGKDKAVTAEPLKTFEKDPTLTNVSNINLYGYFVVDIPMLVDDSSGAPTPIKKELFTMNNISSNVKEVGTPKEITEDNKTYLRHYYSVNDVLGKNDSITLFDNVQMVDLNMREVKIVKGLNKIRVFAIGVQSEGMNKADNQSTIESYLIEVA